MPLAHRRLDFDPTRDGFSFPNSFRWNDTDLRLLSEMLRSVARPVVAVLPAAGGALAGGARGLVAGAVAGVGLAGIGVGDGLVRASARQWSSFGLCGGMALAAAERWPRKAGLPTNELKARYIRALLWRRQFDTLRASAPTFVRYWLAARLHRPVSAASVLHDWAAVRVRIDAGRPAVVGLVGDAPDPFSQHQVLAFGYALTEDGARLAVYDPNSPGEERFVAFAVAGDQARITTDLPVGPTRGGGVHIHSEPGRLHRFFLVDV